MESPTLHYIFEIKYIIILEIAVDMSIRVLVPNELPVNTAEWSIESNRAAPILFLNLQA